MDERLEAHGGQRVEIRTVPRWMKSLLVILVVCATAGSCLTAADDPSGYLHQAGWHESLLASLEAVAGGGVEAGCAPFESDTMRGGDAARPISVPVAGAKDLYLFVTGVPDVKWAVATGPTPGWCAPTAPPNHLY